MEDRILVLILGVISLAMGALLLTNDRFAAFVSRTVWQAKGFDAVKADRYFQGWTGIVIGVGAIAPALFL
jgi:hypothetical protein